MNSALLAKQAWRVIQNPNALWVHFLKSIYYPNGTFKQARKKRGSSCAWQSLLHGRDVIRKEGRWHIADGRSIDIRTDRWIHTGEKVELPDSADIQYVGDHID